MRDITLNVDPPKDGQKHYLFKCLSNVSVRVYGLRVNWQDNNNLWLGISSGECVIILPALDTRQ